MQSRNQALVFLVIGLALATVQGQTCTPDKSLPINTGTTTITGQLTGPNSNNTIKTLIAIDPRPDYPCAEVSLSVTPPADNKNHDYTICAIAYTSTSCDCTPENGVTLTIPASGAAESTTLTLPTSGSLAFVIQTTDAAASKDYTLAIRDEKCEQPPATPTPSPVGAQCANVQTLLPQGLDTYTQFQPTSNVWYNFAINDQNVDQCLRLRMKLSYGASSSGFLGFLLCLPPADVCPVGEQGEANAACDVDKNDARIFGYLSATTSDTLTLAITKPLARSVDSTPQQYLGFQSNAGSNQTEQIATELVPCSSLPTVVDRADVQRDVPKYGEPTLVYVTTVNNNPDGEGMFGYYWYVTNGEGEVLLEWNRPNAADSYYPSQKESEASFTTVKQRLLAGEYGWVTDLSNGGGDLFVVYDKDGSAAESNVIAQAFKRFATGDLGLKAIFSSTDPIKTVYAYPQPSPTPKPETPTPTSTPTRHPTPEPTSSDPHGSNGDSRISTGAILAIVGGIFVVIIVVIYLCCRHHSHHRRPPHYAVQQPGVFVQPAPQMHYAPGPQAQPAPAPYVAMRD